MTPALAALATPDSRGLGGLVAILEGAERPLPLRSVKVRAFVAGDCCRTEIEQRYANPYDTGLEAVHILPLPDEGAVVEVELRAGDLVVKGECRERKEAEATFAAAREAGHRAVLLTAERADVHTLTVTNLPPKTEVTVKIVVVERLETLDGRTRWRFPTTLAPRYTPGTEIGHTGPGTSPDTTSAPDASRLSPPILLGKAATLDLEIQVRGIVRTVESSLHVAKVTLEDGGVRVAPKGGATVDRDFILTWTTATPDRTEVRAFTDGTATLVVVDPPNSVLPEPLPRDAVFVIDISGSMEGTKMDAAKRALSAALHGLLPRDRFALYAFDDRLESFRAGFAPYDDATLAAADAWIAGLHARGGTVMLPAIQKALDGETPAGRLRTVLFITDGQAHNDQELVAAVANRRGRARFFTLGIDTAVNAALMRRLARVGGGTCELCTPSDDIEEVITRIEARFGMPLAEGVKIEGGELAAAGERVLFAGRPVTALVAGAPDKVRVTGRTAGAPIVAEAVPERIDFPIAALWARERVAELEDRLALRPFEEEAIRGEVLRVALPHGIASRWTAFVAVERSSSFTGERVAVVQPAAAPAEWDMMAGAGVPSGAAAMPRPAAPASMAPPPPAARRERGVIDRVRGMFARDEARSAPAPVMAEMAEEAAPLEKRAQAAPAPAKSAPADTDPGALLSRTQSADGSFGGDVRRTASALLALVLLGNTRHAGLRKRAVLKAAAWLTPHAADPWASVALAALSRVERGDDAGYRHELRMLAEDTVEGRIVRELIQARFGKV